MQLKSAPASLASPAPCDPRQLDLAIGGQAVIEGVMMRSPTAVATAVRNAAGRIVVRKRPFRSIVRRVPALGVPVLRGGVHLIESLGIGLARSRSPRTRRPTTDRSRRRDRASRARPC